MKSLAYLITPMSFWLFCLVWFLIIQKPMFGLFNSRSAKRRPDIADIAAVYRHGFVSDCIISSYLTAIPLLIAMTGALTSPQKAMTALTVYNMVISLAVGMLATADTVLYSFWKYKIDSSVFAYLKTPKEAFASVTTPYLLTAVLVWLAVSATFFLGAETVTRFASSATDAPACSAWWSYLLVIVVFVLSLAALFVVIRGLRIRPNNPSIVYFSDDPFLNHWALNPGYSMIYSLSVKDDFKGMFRYMPQNECDAIISELFPASASPEQRLLKTERPDILLIIWESFAAEYSGFFGGKEPSTPNLDELARQGVAFTHCHAASFRTDRGLVGVLSGYPAQPTTSIIRHTRKLPGLPGLARTLADRAGYTTTAIHGGDMSFMHMSDYYLASGHHRLIGLHDFPEGLESCKWGIHDDPVMQRAADEAIRLHKESDDPFFISVMTLSSHEPFIVPERRMDNDIRNAYAYTDNALGRMVDRLRKQTDLWDNLLLVVIADHGLNIPRPTLDRRSYSHIPMVLGGGAVSRPAVIDSMLSQTDLAATLLGQLGIAHDDFIFSRDVLATGYRHPFGLHIFGNGIMMCDPAGYTLYDTLLEKITEGDNDPERLQRMKAILQKIYEDLDRL